MQVLARQTVLTAHEPAERLRSTREDLLGLMVSSRAYLAADLEEPGHARALAEIDRDLAALSGRPESDLPGLKAGLTAEGEELRRKANRMGRVALAGMAIGAASLPLGTGWGLAIGMTGAAVLLGAGLWMHHQEVEQLSLLTRLEGWERQLASLQNVAAEVHSLASPGASPGVEQQGDFLLVGGVRVPRAAG